MKKILVLTDLSDTAATAAQAAVPLTAKLNANIVLLHSWTPQPALAEYPNNSWGIDTLVYGEQTKDKLNYLREQLIEQIDLLSPDLHHASIDWEQEDGSIADRACEHTKKGDVEMIVMGASASSGLDHLFLGSDTYSVISKANRPVLIIPSGQILSTIDKVTFASDFSENDIAAVHYLTRLARKFDFEIEIVHVMVFGKDDSETLERKKAFQQHIAKFNYAKITYENIYGKNITDRLQNLCREHASDLLVLSYDQHSFWSKLFHGTQSSELLKKQQIPVLIIPALLNKNGL